MKQATPVGPVSHPANSRTTFWFGGGVVALQVVVICMLAVLLTRLKPLDTSPTPTASPQTPSATDQLLARIADDMNASRWGKTYDQLNALMILSPERADVFNAVLTCVEASLASDDSASADLAWDLYVRADAMVPYQSPDTMEHARQRVDALRPHFETTSVEPTVDALVVFKQDIRRILPQIRNTQVPLEVRTQLTAQLRGALDTLVGAVVLGEYTPKVPMNVFWNQMDRARKDCDRIEQELLDESFVATREAAERWLTQDVASALANVDTEDGDEQPLTRLAIAGQAHLNAIGPYRAAEVRGASELADRVEVAVDRLIRAGNWAYNRLALQQIKAIRASTTRSNLQKLEALAAIREDWLGDHAQKQFGLAWQDAFDALKTDEDKLQAAKLRIVRSLTP